MIYVSSNATWKANMGKSAELIYRESAKYLVSSNAMLYLCDDGCETPDHAYFTALASKARENILLSHIQHEKPT
jgi:hypothetical protein